MAVHVFAAIEEYLGRIHSEFIWPTIAPASRGKKAPAPDKLAHFQRVLMETYAKSVRLMQPARRVCQDNGDCRQNETCLGGECVPASSLRDGTICQDNGDCKQDEICLAGVCTPPPAEMSFAPADEPPVYGDDLKTELLAYNSRISGALTKALGAKPANLGAARDLLMQAYAQAWRIAGKALKPCNNNGDCADGEVCVEGVCVPIPFRLVYRTRRNPLRHG